MKNRLEERALQLTEEEALGLLELAMSCPLDLSFEQRAALVKLSDFCRQFMRAEGHCMPKSTISNNPKNAREEVSVSSPVAA